jgi:flavin reductase (DIM6/NTAB) family NADH-FMN oxidoreductase RutF
MAQKVQDFGDDVATMAPAVANSNEVRTVFNGFPAAVGALCALVDGQPQGMVATSLAVGVSYNPPMVSFSVRNDSSTWPILQGASRIGISVLAEGQGPACRQLASKDADRFAGLDVTATDEGALFISGAITWMDCEIAGELPAGDHTVGTFLVHEVGHTSAAHPLLFHNGRFPRMRHE